MFPKFPLSIILKAYQKLRVISTISLICQLLCYIGFLFDLGLGGGILRFSLTATQQHAF